MRMTEPLPNCFSIWPSAASSALSRSVSAICLSPLPLLLRPVLRHVPARGRSLAVTLRRGCDGPRRRCGRSITNVCSYNADPPADKWNGRRTVPISSEVLAKRVVAVTRSRRRSRAKLTGPEAEAGAKEALVFRRRAGGRRSCWRAPCFGATAALAGARGGNQPRPPAPRHSTGQAVATTQSWSVHYDSSSTQSKQTLARRRGRWAGVGQPDGQHGHRHHHDRRDRRHHLRQGQRRRAEEPGRPERVPGGRSRRGSGSTSRRTTLRSPRSSLGVRSHDVATQLLLKGPLSLGHPRTLDGYAVDAIDGTQTFARQGGPRRPLRPRPRAPTSQWRRTRWTRRGSPPPPST